MGVRAILRSSSLIAPRSIGVSIVAEPFLAAEIAQKLAGSAELSLRACAVDAGAGFRVLDDPGLGVLLVAADSGAFISEAKKRQADVRILALLREANARAAREALDAGADGCCLTAIQPAVLSDAITVLAEGAVWLDHEIADLLFARPPKEGRIRSGYQQLSPRERDVLDLVVAGFTNDEIAAALGRARPTVRTHLASVYRKLGVNDRVSAAVRALGEKAP